jgi:hypothetical protein
LIAQCEAARVLKGTSLDVDAAPKLTFATEAH